MLLRNSLTVNLSAYRGIYGRGERNRIPYNKPILINRFSLK